MAARSAAKAVILRDGCILLNQCRDKVHGVYYDLPGGGQEPYEPLEQTLRRECLEETGNLVEPEAFLALCEEIYEGENLRARYPDHTHRVLHIFLCTLVQEHATPPTERDMSQEQSVWMPLSALSHIHLRPSTLAPCLEELLQTRVPRYLGCDTLVGD